MDAQELAERERRRQIALTHQDAIRKQLEDRERRRREERDRRIKEEQEEELRIERDQELERQRRDEELRQIKEKQERERKRKEAIQEAIELAQKEAELVKSRRKVHNINLAQSNNDSETSVRNYGKSVYTERNIPVKEEKENSEQLNNMRETPIRPELLNNDITNNLESSGKSTAGATSDSNQEISSNKETNSQSFTYNNLLQNSIITPRTENVTLLMPTGESIQNIQYAFLVPVIPQSIPLATSNVPESARSCSTARTENRILTPTVYRNKNVILSDSSTQTEESVFSRGDTSSDNKEKYVREKLTNLELSYESRNRKERRSRSESLEERPKWGANRPPTRYLKQSEKDLLYQRKKLRQKVRETKMYDYKNSSDDSQPGSPMTYRRKTYSEKRTSRALWRKHDQIFNRNVRMFQSELVPLESDKGQIFYRKECCCSCRCITHRCSEGNVKIDVLRVEHVSPREKSVSADKTENLPAMSEVDKSIYNSLSELHSGLMGQNEQWEQTPSTPSLHSPK